MSISFAMRQISSAVEIHSNVNVTCMSNVTSMWYKKRKRKSSSRKSDTDLKTCREVVQIEYTYATHVHRGGWESLIGKGIIRWYIVQVTHRQSTHLRYAMNFHGHQGIGWLVWIQYLAWLPWSHPFNIISVCAWLDRVDGLGVYTLNLCQLFTK